MQPERPLFTSLDAERFAMHPPTTSASSASSSATAAADARRQPPLRALMSTRAASPTVDCALNLYTPPLGVTHPRGPIAGYCELCVDADRDVHDDSVLVAAAAEQARCCA